MLDKLLAPRTEQCFIRRCLLRLSARVSTMGHKGHLCCSGLCDFICFFILVTSFPQTLHGHGVPCGLWFKTNLYDLTNDSIFANLWLRGSCGILFSSTPLFSPAIYVTSSLLLHGLFIMLTISDVTQQSLILSNVSFTLYPKTTSHHFLSHMQAVKHIVRLNKFFKQLFNYKLYVLPVSYYRQNLDAY